MPPPPHRAVPCCSILYLLCRFLSDPWYWGTLQNFLFSKILWGSSFRSWFVKVLHVNYLSSFERMRKSFSDSPADTSSRTVTWASSQRLDSKAIALHLWMKDLSNHPFLSYPGWACPFAHWLWCSSHLARHWIRLFDGWLSVLYVSQLLVEIALLATKREE